MSSETCWDMETKTIIVHPSSSAPSIGFLGNTCIHQPPVVLNSLNGSPLYWNTGVLNPTADYYSPGVALAYYYDQNGCKSKEAQIIIPSAPDFDALLTGCYKKCEIPPFLNVYNLTKNTISWDWLLNQNGIANGTGNYLFNPLVLPLNGFGTYNLDVNYNNNNCNVESTSLVIEPDDCPCKELEIVKIIPMQQLQECRIIYEVEVHICNNGHHACLEDLFTLNDGIKIHNIENFPLYLNQGDCDKIKVIFEVLNPLTHKASFRIHDKCNDCFIDFSVDINIEIFDCEEDIILEYIDFSPEFSSQAMAYFKFGIHLPSNPQAVFRVWSEPSQVLNYHFDQGGARIDGLAMFDRNLLEQMAQREEEICFHVLICKDDVIRECIVCISAKKLLDKMKDHGFKFLPINNEEDKENDNLNTTQTISPYLVPNPASTEVNIKGIEKDNIAEILLLDINGKNIKKANATNTLDIKNISKGNYIIRVISIENKVYYLKLIKN